MIIMEEILPIHLQEVIFSSSDPKISKQLSKLVQTGKIRKIAARIYTSNFVDSPEIIVKRNLFSILGRLYPGSVLSHRSALEFKPTESGHIFISYTYTKKAALPGITVRVLEGPGPLKGDNPISEGLFVSQLARALLENLQSSRKQGAESKSIQITVIEERLEQIIKVKGEEGLNELRDNARIISDQFGMQREFSKLYKLISALLSTRPSKILSSPIALARAFGYPYDPLRLSLFEKLFIELKQTEFKYLPDKNISTKSFTTFAFFEAYFSNYIEGIEFELEEAKTIIETETPLPARNEDSHDILGTYRLVSNEMEMSITPDSPDKLLEILLCRHKALLSSRESSLPGQFKDRNNRAGETHFVDHNLVKGTLIKGFDFYASLTHPFARASYMMFMISEVHPFIDGNGRIARIMMNTEMVKQKQTRIIIPTVYRDDYLLALRRLSRKEDPQPYIKMLSRAQEFSSTITGTDVSLIERHLELSNAFKDHEQAKLKIIHN